VVRKWSYIKNLDFKIIYPGLRPLKFKYKFKIFRNTTRFKKYNLNFTKFTRKLNFRIKRQTNLLTLSFIGTYWSYFFLKLKQIQRFFQSLGLISYKLYLPEYNFFKNSFLSFISTKDIIGGGCYTAPLISHLTRSAIRRFYVLNSILWKPNFLYNTYSYAHVYTKFTLNFNKHKPNFFLNTDILTRDLNLLNYENTNFFYCAKPIDQSQQHANITLALSNYLVPKNPIKINTPTLSCVINILKIYKNCLQLLSLFRI